MENRQLAGRPELVEELTPKEVLDEKTAVQRALLYIESLHGRPATYKHKDLLRPLYDRYRILKVCLLGFMCRCYFQLIRTPFFVNDSYIDWRRFN